jgi:integrase/recombinase XerD
LDWQTGLIGFKSYLRLERSLSANTIEAYLHDVDMLMQFLKPNLLKKRYPKFQVMI